MSEPLVKSPIAIVGIACRLPGANDLAEYWQLLAAGRDAVTDMPANLVDRELYYTSEKGVRGKTYSVRGGLIPERPLDPTRAGLTPDDLKTSDPAHQIMCGVAADALRHAGLDPFHLPAWRTGVYVGHSGGSPLGGDLAYGTLAEESVDYLRDVPEFASLPGDVQEQVIRDVVARLRSRRAQRNDDGMPETGAHAVAGLIARVLKLSGPQMAIDAACASSLVALALGAAALQQGEIDAAIVGGASFNKCDSLILFSHAQSCSATGSRPFDEAADGLISAEGYVALVIKTLDRALADRDPIHAVIRGIGLSSDGRGRSLWAPRKEGQVQAMRRAYGPGIDAQRVGYVEAHATSTQVGDATEVEALREFFDSVASGRKIPIGSVKSNIGHTLETAGLAGLVKSVLAMQNGLVPPSINVNQLNREIPWSDLPFFVAREPLAWPRDAAGSPRRAAVNAFGIGGLNVHVVVDEYDPGWDYTKDAAPCRTEPCSVLPVDEARLRPTSDDIAIIGRGVILPGASSAQNVHTLVNTGASQITDAPPKRWRKQIGVRPGVTKAYFSPTGRGGFISGYEYDWRKFKIPPKQIDQANPLQFMLLDAARQALEEAGYAAKDFDHARTAVVVGSAFGAEFGNQLQVGLRLPEMKRDIAQALAASGMSNDIAVQTAETAADSLLATKPALLDETGSFTASTLASRISKTLDLMGGAMAIDTNTCSSLAALDAACGLLRSGACSLVLCAGASRAMDLASFELLALRGLLETGGGEANPFTGRYLPGEGVAMVLVKRLADAQRDGDRILGIIRNVTARNLLVDPHQPANVYDDPLQSQIGHTQAAQGLVSLVSALSTRSGGELTVRSVTDQGVEYCAEIVVGATLPTKKLPTKKEPAVTMESAVTQPSPAPPVAIEPIANPRLIRIGAPRIEELPTRLNDAKQHAHELFYHASRFSPADVVRVAIVAADEASLVAKLDLAIQQGTNPAARAALEEQGVFVQTSVSSNRRVAFLFPGQGSQYPDMLRGLADVSPAARETLNEADGLLKQMRGESFAALAWGDATKLGHDVWTTQAAVLVADVMLAAALKERGISPDIVCGHSYGEFAALVAAGVWSLEQALRVTQVRSAAINGSRSGHGGLMSVDAPAERVAALIDQHRCRVYVTHYNAPQQTVVGGDDRSLAEFSALLVSEGLTPRQLPVPSAFHTPLLADTQEPLQRSLAGERLQPPNIPLLSSVTNRYVAEPEEIRGNLVAQMIEPVRWMQLVQRLVQDGATVFVEVGPQQVLTRLTRQVINGTKNIVLVPADHPKRSPAEMLLRVQAALETAGVATGVAHDDRTQHSPLPSTSMFEIEHFDATARRRERRRTGQVAAPAVRVAEKLAPVEQFDATSARREARKAKSIGESVPATSTLPTAAKTASEALPQVAQQSEKATPQLERFLIDFVVEQTGYPAEMIELDWDMEADLGIDSIKRAQLFGELREFFDFEQPGKGGMSLDQFRTLRQVLTFLEGLPGKGTWLANQSESAPPTAAAAPMAPLLEPTTAAAAHTNGHAATLAPQRSSADLEKFLVDFVVEQTGYPPEIVELDADLEADLGIDSIKKAQLFGELREHFTLPLEQMSRLKLAEYRTLRQVLGVLEGLAPSEPVAVTEALASPVVASEPDISAAYDRGLAQGVAEGEQMHVWLRERVDAAWSMDAESRLATLAPDSELVGETWDELRGVAEGAGLHVSNVVAYRQHSHESAKHKNGNGNGHGHGHGHGHEVARQEPRPPIDARPPSTQDDSWLPLADLLSIEPVIASRCVLSMADAPHRPGSPTQPTWHGPAVILGDNAVARAIAERFTRDGRPAHIIVPSDDPLAAAAELERLWQIEPACHLFLTTPRDADAATIDYAAWQRRRERGLMTPYWLCQKWMKLTLDAGLMDRTSIVATVSMGGDFGFGGHMVAAESGALCGMLKAIFIESWVNGFRATPFKTIDAPPSASPAEITEAVWRELAVPSYDCEIGLLHGRRHIVRADRERLSATAGHSTRRNNIRRGGVWVCTGGARGITAYVVKELAQRFGVKLHLIGTAPTPNIPASWRDATGDDLKAIKLEVMQQARAAGRNAIKHWQDTEKLLEIDATMREFAAQGITATYHSCDVSNRDALARVLDRIRATDGPIEGILHGAGVGKDARFDRKEPEKVGQCFRAKVDGALALMDLTRRDPIQHFIGFGSISGRFGANGHTDYSAANDMLCKLVDWYRGQRPEVNAVAFHWHAWGDVGMATKPETKLALEMVDMQFMPAREGLAHLFRELAAGTTHGEVLITDDHYYRMFYPAETLSRSGEAAALKFPLIDEGRPGKQGVQQVTELRLDPLLEPFLIEHRLEDRPLLPVVVGMEMLAEAALKLAGQGRVAALNNVEALNGLRFFSDRAQTARILFGVPPLGGNDSPPKGGTPTYRCELTADFLSRDGKLIEPNRGYLRGEVEIDTSGVGFQPARQSGTARLEASPTLDEQDWQPIEYAERGSKFYLGPFLRACKKIRLGQGVLWGRIYPPMLQQLAGRFRSAEGWIVPSAALDACLYAVGLLAWMQVQPGPSLPFRFGRIALGRLPHPGEACLVQCKFLRKEGRYADFDFTLFGVNGEVIVQVSDYRIVYLA